MSDNEEKKEVKPIKGDDGSLYFELDDKKRVTVRKFKGKLYVDIREFYEKDGEMLPGKKGISLNLQNWEQFRSLIDSIDQCITDI
ncbi:RNA polymerase II transcriptional coactivator, putative (macronuclear) [Tetrahymena thermophila SB210]|uniref:RNA polymerase II transcriptional coactivator, putative n=1 Tax=Tetrahymena thermophila (strain SB210) TaxID=312017 RepID=Q23DS9_TETTS|nr:RNA polymerase II transcriptional coactivator, putative [Tetrahymena thermophila SB210]EAR94686.1 RNA polymerase II transcriptional coactivator, putative [Tetrahymena thermophila SB210]|eukprot:XP_001014607.1 RNA polymerase II transcriptional coactivator, putative [Tetrahymena thermophila SB210]